MRKSLSAILCFVALACQRTEAPAGGKTRVITKNQPTDARNMRVDTVVHPIPVFIDRALLGSQTGPDGSVTAEKTTFGHGEPVYLTMFFRESPVGLQAHVIWMDDKKKELEREQQDMNGGKVVTFRLETEKLKPGKYHADGYWGGNLATEKDFEIGGGGKRNK